MSISDSIFKNRFIKLVSEVKIFFTSVFYAQNKNLIPCILLLLILKFVIIDFETLKRYEYDAQNLVPVISSDRFRRIR